MAAKVCAWATWAEWSAVHRQLASPLGSERGAGVRRVQTWRTRGKLPVAVDLTGSFVEIMLNDPAQNPGTTSPRSEHELQLLYSMAVVRLVNGIVDPAQKKARAGSIAMLAQELDWPQWFVDLRHEATHQRLPSLHLLRLAAREATWLLLERYWRPQQALVERRGRPARVDAAGRSVTPLRDGRFLSRRLRHLCQAAARRRGVAPGAGGEAGGEELAETGSFSPSFSLSRGFQEAPPSSPRPGPSRSGHRRVSLSISLSLYFSPAPPTHQGHTSGEADVAEGQAAIAAQARSPAVAAVAEGSAAREARELLALCPDEGRLLGQLSGTLLAGQPRADGREARAVHALLAAGSDNLAPRLARHVVCQALGWRSPVPEPAPDNSPSLRNICDGCVGEEHSAAASCADVGAVEEEDADRMLRWLEALLARDREGASPSSFTASVAELAPLMRQAALGRIAAAAAAAPARSGALTARAARVWQVIGEAGLDSGAECFASLCCGEPSGGLAAPTLEDAEGLPQALKRRRLGRAGASAAPWTAVGTVLDPNTLEIRCRPERGAASAFLDEAARCWQRWADQVGAEGAPAQGPEEAPTASGPTGAPPRAVVPIAKKKATAPPPAKAAEGADEDCAGAAPGGLGHAALGAAGEEAEFRSRAAALLEAAGLPASQG
ncbi:unnamed protein product [Prorocentrum cordatum]|uniref:Uncharacterized protein n=1 Tax=Prorocentrum cordatum TaxID=2364126 RepID=A0ABN9VAI1_9DINO|nr:unnamed protein product [Polarella glacialis]